MGQGPKIKLTLTIHQVKMLREDMAQHRMVTESPQDAIAWRAIERECEKALDYAAKRATSHGLRPVQRERTLPFPATVIISEAEIMKGFHDFEQDYVNKVATCTQCGRTAQEAMNSKSPGCKGKKSA